MKGCVVDCFIGQALYHKNFLLTLLEHSPMCWGGIICYMKKRSKNSEKEEGQLWKYTLDLSAINLNPGFGLISEALANKQGPRCSQSLIRMWAKNFLNSCKCGINLSKPSSINLSPVRTLGIRRGKIILVELVEKDCFDFRMKDPFCSRYFENDECFFLKVKTEDFLAHLLVSLYTFLLCSPWVLTEFSNLGGPDFCLYCSGFLVPFIWHSQQNLSNISNHLQFPRTYLSRKSVWGVWIWSKPVISWKVMLSFKVLLMSELIKCF